ncbi:MAG: hypothetical protein PVH07_01675 [Chloroflexota bacterium]|jgi:hypothetical protein
MRFASDLAMADRGPGDDVGELGQALRDRALLAQQLAELRLDEVIGAMLRGGDGED